MGGIQLGDRVKDKQTGFEGTVVARIISLYGEDHFTVEMDRHPGQGLPLSYNFIEARLDKK
jgi:hypothetical protein